MEILSGTASGEKGGRSGGDKKTKHRAHTPGPKPPTTITAEWEKKGQTQMVVRARKWRGGRVKRILDRPTYRRKKKTCNTERKM